MRALLLVAAAIVLPACAAAPPVALQGAAKGAPMVVATLSTNDCQFQTAPLYTAATVEAIHAERALRQGRIDVKAAKAVRDAGLRAKAALDAACLYSTTKADAAKLAAGAAEVETMRTILGGAR